MDKKEKIQDSSKTVGVQLASEFALELDALPVRTRQSGGVSTNSTQTCKRADGNPQSLTSLRFVEKIYLAADNLCSDMGFNYVGFSHIADAEHQAQLTVPQTYDCIPGVQQGLGSFFRSRKLCEHDSHLKLEQPCCILSHMNWAVPMTCVYCRC